MALPKKLLERGVSDMVRICDGRMSGTAYGTVVLHVAPEAAAGGPLALVRTGDWISWTCRPRADPGGDRRGARRRAGRVATPAGSPGRRGWYLAYTEHVLQADSGADLDFLRGSRGSAVPRHSH